jgi:hypothetical protein
MTRRFFWATRPHDGPNFADHPFICISPGPECYAGSPPLAEDHPRLVATLERCPDPAEYFRRGILLAAGPELLDAAETLAGFARKTRNTTPEAAARLDAAIEYLDDLRARLRFCETLQRPPSEPPAEPVADPQPTHKPTPTETPELF